MKGTLFSADFIEDREGNLRLLELNTDTSIINQGLDFIDYSPLLEVINSSSIDEVYVVSKRIHEDLVRILSASLVASSSITSFNNILEEDSVIYPTAVEDSDNRFILRMAYDESAIFDSTYAKNKSAPLKLFAQAGYSGSVQEFYISGSDGVFNHIEPFFNDTSIPDITVKDITDTTTSPLGFYKIGNSNLSASQRFDNVKASIQKDTLVTSFYNHPSSSKVESIRSYNIIYGSSLDILNIGTYRIEALFDKPASIDYDDSVLMNKTNQKHYYELTTSHPKYTTAYSWNGIFEEESIVKEDGSTVLISQAQVGDRFKSYFISGSPDSDIVSVFSKWFHSGSLLPSGSYPTSSVLINNLEQKLTYNLIHRVDLADSSSFRASAVAHVLVYDSERDGLRYETIDELIPGTHNLVNVSGSSIPVVEVVREVLDGNYSSYIVDMESTDTFFLSDTELNIKIVTHNCFPAGTQITLADGSLKNIEDLLPSEKVLTWNENTKEVSEGLIGNIQKKKERLLIRISTTLGDIKSTALHKFFVKSKGWVSAQDITIGDILFNETHSEVEVTGREDLIGDFEVYHILDVKDNHTYFAQHLLVHNSKFVIECFPAGTKITMSDGSSKDIEKVEVGDEVLSFNEETKQQEIKIVTKCNSPIHNDLVKYTFNSGESLICTFDHPLYVNDLSLASFIPEWTTARYELNETISKIKQGDSVYSSNGDILTIVDIEALRPDSTQTYIITVEDNHNFYANNILVHNK